MSTPYPNITLLKAEINAAIYDNTTNAVKASTIASKFSDVIDYFTSTAPSNVQTVTGNSVGTTPVVLQLASGGSIPIPLNTAIQFTASILAFQTGGSSGVIGDALSWSYIGTVKNVSGTLTFFGTVTVIAQADSALSTSTVTFSPNNTTKCIDVTVTGPSNINMTWQINVTLNSLLL